MQINNEMADSIFLCDYLFIFSFKFTPQLASMDLLIRGVFIVCGVPHTFQEFWIEQRSVLSHAAGRRSDGGCCQGDFWGGL